MWFVDIIWRVRTMRSPRFLWLPPASFYLDLNLKALLHRFRLRSFGDVFRTLYTVWLRGRNFHVSRKHRHKIQ